VTVYNSLTSAGGQPASGSRAGYSVTLNGQSGLPVQSQVTNQIGQASFLSVPSGIYSLSETPPPGSTFASMSINGDPAQLQQPFRLQAAGNYEIDITNQVSTPAGSAATTGCPSSVVSSVAEDRVWEQACAILPSVVSSSAGAGSSSSAAPAPASSSSGSTTSASNAAAPSSTSTASAGSISVGTLVQVAGTGNGLNVRSSPTTSAGIVTTLSDGATATVIGGPQTGDGYTWWQLDAGGWAVSDYLSAAPSQPSGS